MYNIFTRDDLTQMSDFMAYYTRTVEGILEGSYWNLYFTIRANAPKDGGACDVSIELIVSDLPGLFPVRASASFQETNYAIATFKLSRVCRKIQKHLSANPNLAPKTQEDVQYMLDRFLNDYDQAADERGTL